MSVNCNLDPYDPQCKGICAVAQTVIDLCDICVENSAIPICVDGVVGVGGVVGDAVGTVGGVKPPVGNIAGVGGLNV